MRLSERQLPQLQETQLPKSKGKKRGRGSPTDIDKTQIQVRTTSRIV